VGKVAAVALLDQLREQRSAARTAADTILERAAAEQRDLTADEVADHTARSVETRELDDRIEQLLADQVAELRAAQTRRQGPTVPREPVLTREQSVYDWCQARGMFDPAEQELSFDRYLRGLATARWDGADHERALAEATVGAGGALVPSPLSSRVIDLARNATRVFQAGAVTVPMTSQTLALARLLTEGTPAWKTENAAITAADMTFDRVTFTARTLVRLITLSVELFEDADPSSEGIIARSFAAQMALELDRVALLGTGTAPEPRGVLNQSGITSTAHGAAGTVISTTTAYDWHLDAAGAVRAANFTPNAHIQAPRTSTSLSKLREHAADADHEVGTDQPHGRRVDRLLANLHRGLVAAAHRRAHRLQSSVPRRALPGRQPPVRLPRLPARRRAARPADRVRGRYRRQRVGRGLVGPLGLVPGRQP
jgi:HK97 family phage major capsid protein